MIPPTEVRAERMKMGVSEAFVKDIMCQYQMKYHSRWKLDTMPIAGASVLFPTEAFPHYACMTLPGMLALGCIVSSVGECSRKYLLIISRIDPGLLQLSHPI